MSKILETKEIIFVPEEGLELFDEAFAHWELSQVANWILELTKKHKIGFKGLTITYKAFVIYTMGIFSFIGDCLLHFELREHFLK